MAVQPTKIRGPIELDEIVTPPTPAAGKVRTYPKSDHHMYQLDSTGAETDLTAAGGSVSFATISRLGGAPSG